LLTIKAGLALARAGRREEAEALRSDLNDRFADELVTLGGQTARAVELFRKLATSTADESPARPSASPKGVEPPDLSRPVEAAWQVKLAATVEAGMSQPELTQWESNPVSNAVPSVAASGSRLFVNYLGHDFAVDLESGKMLWRSASFHHLRLTAMQNQGRMLEPERFAILADGDLVWSLGRDMKDQNMMAPFALICRRGDGGEVVWKSTDLGDYAGLDLVGEPVLADGKLFVVAKWTGNNPNMMPMGGMQPQQPGGPRFMALAIRPHDGKILWKTDVANFRQNNQFRFWYWNMTPDAQPRLAYRAGSLYVDTHQGVLARLDADSGALDWGFGYQTDPAQGGQRFIIFFGEPMQQSQESSSGAPMAVGESFLVKGAQSGKLYSVDPNRMAVRWERPIAKSTRLLGTDGRNAYLGGAELGSLDLATRALRWATRLPGGSASGKVLARPEGIWQLTPRGVFELDPKDGAVRRIFRGEDLGSAGGDLVLTDRWLLTVSNRTITAYPRRPGGVAATAKERASR
jgi:outer membrane protein assembly factor BamB